VDPIQIVAEPRRREILRLVWDRDRTAGDIASHVDVSFSAVSQHLGILRGAGFVTVRREGKQRYYRADLAAIGTLKDVLEAMWSTQVDRLAVLAEEAQHSDPERASQV
jgi:DNA-binding transcriptional ArsR family regulator